MKTTGMPHQLEALRASNGKKSFAYFMEMGTGKTWTILADAERLYAGGKIDGLLVFAPKGVHTNWVRREIPTHMDAPVIARAWRSGAGKKEMQHIEQLFDKRLQGDQVPLRVLSMNIDAVRTKAGFEFAKRFLLATKAMIAIDESSRIKNPDSMQTQKFMALRRLACVRRIANGSPITNAPLDIFSQMEFLESGLLGTTSYRAFVAEYAVLLDTNSRMFQRMIEENPRIAHAQIVATNPDGSKRWRNLDKLQNLLKPHMFRVLKKDCLSLPEKIYKQVYFDLDSKQQAAYKLMEDEYRIVLEDGQVESVAALSAMMKLQQITSGFVMKPDRSGVLYVTEGNPRLEAIMETLEGVEGKVIIWARFKEELRALAELLTAEGRKVVQYHGDVSDEDREIAVDSFQNGDAEIFLGQPQSGGVGLTLTAAETVFYCSNDFNLWTRMQSEDRCHRIGTKNNVVYFDFVASKTMDETIASALQRKANLAAEILGDMRRDFQR